jgi:hypothetical protein
VNFSSGILTPLVAVKKNTKARATRPWKNPGVRSILSMPTQVDAGTYDRFGPAEIKVWRLHGRGFRNFLPY